MTAWVVNGAGPPKDVLQLKSDVSTPGPPEGADILVKVSYAALNPMDLVLMKMWIPFRRNGIPAVDFAGEIIQVGPDVSTSSLRPGMTVCGMLPTSLILRGYGTLAEYMVVSGDMVAEKPKQMDSAAAAGAMGVAGQSSAILIRAADLGEHRKVLINGSSGGLGTLLVQVLHAQGHEVVGICSKSNEDMVKRLGASEVSSTATRNQVARAKLTF